MRMNSPLVALWETAETYYALLQRDAVLVSETIVGVIPPSWREPAVDGGRALAAIGIGMA